MSAPQSVELANVHSNHNNQFSPTNDNTNQSVNQSVTSQSTNQSPHITPPLKPVNNDLKSVATLSDNQSVNGSTNQPINQSQPIKQKGFKAFYYRWINPWIRWLFIFVILYIYAISSGALTYRNNQFQGEMQYLLNIKWREAYGGDQTNLPPSVRPDREADQSYQISYNGQTYTIDGYVPFILKDLWFDFIPALQGDLRSHWQGFADATPIIFNIVMFIMLIVRRDVIRLSEYISVQMIMFAVNALVHVSTTFPDSNGQQENCKAWERQQYGDWIWGMITTQYCGDMLWSGHTANTLVPIIMIRRLMWDFLGWNITWAEVDDTQHHVKRDEFLSKHSQLFSDWNNSHERNQLFVQWMQANGVHDKHAAASLENYAPAYRQAGPIDQPINQNQSINQLQKDPEIIADELALQKHENHDIHINIAAATAVGPNQTVNQSSDKLFKIYKSPYQTPTFVQKHRKAFFIGTSIIRVCLIVWFALLCISIILIRYHYSVDVIIACFVTMLVMTNTHMLQWWVRQIYRPNYTNYLTPRAFWKPVYLRWPLNEEQINFEERVRRVGIGGIL